MPWVGPATGALSVMTRVWLLPYISPWTQVGTPFTQMEQPGSLSLCHVTWEHKSTKWLYRQERHKPFVFTNLRASAQEGQSHSLLLHCGTAPEQMPKENLVCVQKPLWYKCSPAEQLQRSNV